MSDELALVVVADDAAQVRRSLIALTDQSVQPEHVVVCSWDGLDSTVQALETEWLALVPDGAEPSPEWVEVLTTNLGLESVGCIGGRVLRLSGASTLTEWFDEDAPVAWYDGIGEEHSHLADVPNTVLRCSASFLRYDNMAARIRVARALLQAGVPLGRSVNESSACLVAARMGLDVVYDSRLVVCRILPPSMEDRIGGFADWRAASRSGMWALRHLPGAGSSARVLHRILIGTRRMPGMLLGPAFWPKPARRHRWLQVVRGSIDGLK